MQLEPFLFFYGRCEEALEFYKKVFGGSYDLFRYEGSPMADHVPPDFRNKVMRATFHSLGFEFMAGDGQPGKTLDPDAGNISLSIALSTGQEAEGQRIFDALGEGGTIGIPIGDVHWGGKFGMVTDKFATEWMISIR
jgi:PhnB protein